jgi:hypothetical protein
MNKELVFPHSKRSRTNDPVSFYCPREPRLVMYDFFQNDTLTSIHKRCDKFVTAAFHSNKAHLPELPQQLYFFQDLLLLVEGLHTLYKKEKLAAIEKSSFAPDNFVQQYKVIMDKLPDTREHPLYLTPVEWLHPRMVIMEFFRLHPLPMWKYILHRMLQSTTGSQPILSQYIFNDTNLWQECLLLRKLIEAAWMIRIVHLPEWEN